MASSSYSSEGNSKSQQYFDDNCDSSKWPSISPDRAELLVEEKCDADDNEPTPELIFSKHELIGLKSCLKSSGGGLQPAVKRVRFDIIDVSSRRWISSLIPLLKLMSDYRRNLLNPHPFCSSVSVVPTQKFVCVEAELGEDMASFLNSMKPATPSTSKGANGVKKKRPITRTSAVSQRPLNGTSDVSANNKQTLPPTSSARSVSSKEPPKTKFPVREENRDAQGTIKEAEVQSSKPSAKGQSEQCSITYRLDYLHVRKLVYLFEFALYIRSTMVGKFRPLFLLCSLVCIVASIRRDGSENELEECDVSIAVQVVVLFDITPVNATQSFSNQQIRLTRTLRHLDVVLAGRNKSYAVIAFHRVPVIETQKRRRVDESSPAKALDAAAEHVAKYGFEGAKTLVLLVHDGHNTDLIAETLEATAKLVEMKADVFVITGSDHPNIPALVATPKKEEKCSPSKRRVFSSSKH
uniref:VWFA domain-containing protein n=1 Tax=Ditylenchus dipsaci TaxID=166011 RepID=A0A915D4K0_9BILA